MPGFLGRIGIVAATAVALLFLVIALASKSSSSSPLTIASPEQVASTSHASRASGGPPPDYQLEKKIPKGVDVFDLSLKQTRSFSATQNFKVIGHSYLKGPWLTQYAQSNGMGAGFNTVRVADGIAYLAGYNGPPTTYGILLVDVHDPSHIKPLSFIPCNPGTRCPYLRVDPQRHLLIFANDFANANNPVQPPPGEPIRGGYSFYDVSNPAHPVKLSFWQNEPNNGKTHGLDFDGRYVYGCTENSDDKPLFPGMDELDILDAADPSHPQLVSRVHIEGQRNGETFAPNDETNPDGSSQLVWCHEVAARGDRVYVAWRDAGVVIVDISDKSNPEIISRLDYIGPFNGGSLGASHSFVPVPPTGGGEPKLAVDTDEIFSCPPGFGRIVDISQLSNPQIISSFRIPAVDDNYDSTTGKFSCPPGQQSIHLPWFDYRSPGLMYVTWYDQGIRAWDISNPFEPRAIGYYISPQYAVRGIPGYPADRQSREVYQDPTTGLIYATDGNGGGLTILRWTGQIPSAPLPGAR